MTEVRRTVDPRKVGGLPASQEGMVKKPLEEEPEPQIIVEEKLVDKNGEYTKKYLRGKFLGKVCVVCWLALSIFCGCPFSFSCTLSIAVS